MTMGSILIGEQGCASSDCCQAVDRATGEQLDPGSHLAGAKVEQACALADAVFESFSTTT